MVATKRTKRFFVDELHKNDSTLSKTKLFKMKIAELENLYNNLNLTASTSDNYSRATFDDISDEEKEPDISTQVKEQEQEVVEPVKQEVKQEVKDPEVPKAKFNRRELKKMLLEPFNKEVTDLIRDLDDGIINEPLAMNEFNIVYEEYLQSVEHYTRDMEMTEKDIDYVDNFFALQEKRLLE